MKCSKNVLFGVVGPKQQVTGLSSIIANSLTPGRVGQSDDHKNVQGRTGLSVDSSFGGVMGSREHQSDYAILASWKQV